MMTVREAKNRLSDGRVVRPLEGKYTQAQMFALKGKVPSSESIMGVRDLDDALNKSNVWRAINVNGWWRTSRYGVYARGFEKGLDKTVGKEVVWVEDGVSYTFEVPDVKHPLLDKAGLRQATGMLEFPLSKLQYDEDRRIVSVAPDFDPEADVTVKDIMRPRGWALVDADGYPLRSKPSDSGNSEARYSSVRHSDEFDDAATGWHGSVARDVGDYYGVGGRRGVGAYFDWRYGSGVAVVGREATTPKIEVAETEDKGILIKGVGLEALQALTQASGAEVEALLKTLRPEALEATRRLLQALEIKE